METIDNTTQNKISNDKEHIYFQDIPFIPFFDFNKISQSVVKKKTLTFVITGATGFLGSNFIQELLNFQEDELDHLNLIVLGRNTEDESLKNRVASLFGNSDYPYLTFEHHKKGKEKTKFLAQKAKYININLQKDDLGISDIDLANLKNIEIDYFFHIAALTDLRLTDLAREKNIESNYKGTHRILNFIETNNIKVKEFDHVSTAYVSGKKEGLISPNYTNIHEKFNNSYEYTKLLAELEVEKFAKRTGIKYRIFRPSVICGRLLDGNLGAINKYDVFYQFAVFFLMLKSKFAPDQDLNKPWETDIRAYYLEDGGVNIVPVDYVAKMMYQICLNDHPDTHFNLTNTTNVIIGDFVKILLKEVNVTGVKHVEFVPSKLNKFERLYYSHCGQIFEAYASYRNKKFDDSNLRALKEKTGIYCPEINSDKFDILFKYARNNSFGLFS